MPWKSDKKRITMHSDARTSQKVSYSSSLAKQVFTDNTRVLLTKCNVLLFRLHFHAWCALSSCLRCNATRSHHFAWCCYVDEKAIYLHLTFNKCHVRCIQRTNLSNNGWTFDNTNMRVWKTRNGSLSNSNLETVNLYNTSNSCCYIKDCEQLLTHSNIVSACIAWRWVVQTHFWCYLFVSCVDRLRIFQPTRPRESVTFKST